MPPAVYHSHDTVKAAMRELQVIGRVIGVLSGFASRMRPHHGTTQGPHGTVLNIRSTSLYDLQSIGVILRPVKNSYS